MIVLKSIYHTDKERKANDTEKIFYEYLTENENDSIIYIVCGYIGGRNYVIFLSLYGRSAEKEGDGDSKRFA